MVDGDDIVAFGLSVNFESSHLPRNRILASVFTPAITNMGYELVKNPIQFSSPLCVDSRMSARNLLGCACMPMGIQLRYYATHLEETRQTKERFRPC